MSALLYDYAQHVTTLCHRSLCLSVSLCMSLCVSMFLFVSLSVSLSASVSQKNCVYVCVALKAVYVDV